MKSLFVFVIGLFFSVMSFAGNSGLNSVKSSQDFKGTVAKLEKLLKMKKFTIFAKVDHSKNAQSAGLKLNPSTVFIFGNPKVGTPLMNASGSFGIDLPVKIHVHQNEKGEVFMSYNEPLWLAQRHGASKDLPQIKKMSGALAALTKTAGQK